MILEQSVAKKIKITDVYGLDPISVYLEDFEPGKGKITISCYDKSWHSYWGSMGDRTISEFFLSCDNHYIAKNLSSLKSSVNDYEKLGSKIKEAHADNYNDDDIDAIELYEIIDSMIDDEEWDVWIRSETSIMQETFGCEWWYSIPTKENPKYKYLCDIIDVVKEALKKTQTE